MDGGDWVARDGLDVEGDLRGDEGVSVFRVFQDFRRPQDGAAAPVGLWRAEDPVALPSQQWHARVGEPAGQGMRAAG